MRIAQILNAIILKLSLQISAKMAIIYPFCNKNLALCTTGYTVPYLNFQAWSGVRWGGGGRGVGGEGRDRREIPQLFALHAVN